MSRFSYAPGALAALLAAGPIGIAILSVGSMLFDAGPAAFDWRTIPAMLALAVIAVPIGMIVAGLPILLGGYGLGRIGLTYFRSRHPLYWVATGAVVGAMIEMALFGAIPVALALFALNGGLCALIVRYGTRWSDDDA